MNRSRQGWTSRLIRGLAPFAPLLLVVLCPPHSLAGGPQAASGDKSTQCESHVVRQIEIDGNENTRYKKVRRKMTFLEEKVFLETDVEQTIKRLNRWGHFQKVTREDITVTFGVDKYMDESERCYADIVIHLKEKKQ